MHFVDAVQYPKQFRLVTNLAIEFRDRQAFIGEHIEDRHTVEAFRPTFIEEPLDIDPVGCRRGKFQICRMFQ